MEHLKNEKTGLRYFIFMVMLLRNGSVDIQGGGRGAGIVLKK